MKIPWILLFLGLIGCNRKEKLVSLAEDSQPKTVMIYVTTIVDVLNLDITDEGFVITKATATTEICGAGVYVSPYGHILTCAHLFEVGKIQKVTTCNYDGLCSTSTLLYKDHKMDLGLVKSSENTAGRFVRLADPRKLKVGQTVIAIGNPLGAFDFSVTHGIISALNRDIVGYNLTQSDAFINPGNSGGPLFNLDGELVGINAQMYSPIDAPIFTGIGMSVSPAQIIQFLTLFRGADSSLPKYDMDYWRN